jgi:hypothetical protein
MSMGVKDFNDHFCIAIFPQGQWKEATGIKLVSNVKESFLRAGGHLDCKVCCTCSICRSFEEMFDPRAPGKHDVVCDICNDLYALLRSRLGRSEGIILFSHYTPVTHDVVDALFKEKNVKKVFVLQFRKKRTESYDRDKLVNLRSEIVSEEDASTFENKDNIIFEIRRKKYLK